MRRPQTRARVPVTFFCLRACPKSEVRPSYGNKVGRADFVPITRIVVRNSLRHRMLSGHQGGNEREKPLRVFSLSSRSNLAFRTGSESGYSLLPLAWKGIPLAVRAAAVNATRPRPPALPHTRAWRSCWIWLKYPGSGCQSAERLVGGDLGMVNVSCLHAIYCATVAQSAEHRIRNAGVAGSTPIGGSSLPI